MLFIESSCIFMKIRLPLTNACHVCTVKLAVPCLTMVVEIRGETHATQSWVDDGLVPHKPWDGDMGSIQELFYGVSTVKASSYKEAYKMCVRKHVEDGVSKAQMAVNEHDRRRQKLAFALGAMRHELDHLSKACWRLRAERSEEILRQVLNRRRHWADTLARACVALHRCTVPRKRCIHVRVHDPPCASFLKIRGPLCRSLPNPIARSAIGLLRGSASAGGWGQRRCLGPEGKPHTIPAFGLPALNQRTRACRSSCSAPRVFFLNPSRMHTLVSFYLGAPRRGVATGVRALADQNG